MAHRIRVKSKRVQFLGYLLFLAILVPGVFNGVKDIHLAWRLSSDGQVVEGRVIRTWTNRRKGVRSYYVAYEFDLGDLTFRANHSTTEPVMLQARETRLVPVYYLADYPSTNAPQFWGGSLWAYAARMGGVMLLLSGLCSILGSQVGKMIREDSDALHLSRYTWPELLFGLIVILFAGFGIRGMLSWSSSQPITLGLPEGKNTTALLSLSVMLFVLLVFGMLAMQERD